MRTISESLSCNLPRCKGTPERTTCGKKPTRRKGVTTVTEPAFAGKKRMRVRSIARAIVSSDRPIISSPPSPRTSFLVFSFLFFPFIASPSFFSSPFLSFFFFPSPPFFLVSFPLIFPRERARVPRATLDDQTGEHFPRPSPSSASAGPATAGIPRECSSQCSAHAITETIDVDTH